MRRTTLVSVLLILALAGSALQQQQAAACFSGKIPDVKLLKGDIHAIDLDSYVVDSKLSFTTGVDVSDAEGIVNTITTFNDFSPNEYILNQTEFGTVDRCTSYSQGLSDGDWAFLCDQNKIVFISVNETLGSFDPQRTTVVNLAPLAEDADLSCDSIRNGGTQNLYAVCQKKNSDSIFIFTLDLAAPTRQDPDEIKQPDAKFKLVAPFKLSVNEYLTDAGPQVSIFVHEREPKTNQLHFRMFKFAKGKLIDGGYFSTLVQGSIKNGKDGQLLNVFVNDEFVFLQTRVGAKNYLQKCLRNPIYSTFVCEDFQTTLAEGDYRIKFFYVDKTKRTTKMVWVYYVSTTVIKLDLFDPDTNTYIPEVDSFSISGHSLKSVVDYQRAGNNVYLIGPTDAGKLQIADGVIKFKTRTNTWEEFSYGPDASLGLVMQDLHETHFANYLSAGSNKINFNRIKKNILMYNTASLDAKYSTLVVTVNCTGAVKNSRSSLSFSVYTQPTVNDEDSLRVSVPSVEAYVGSSYIYIPTNGDDISGNAPVLKSIDAGPLSNITFEYQMFNKEEVDYTTPELEGLTGFKHVGENWFAIDNVNTLSFFQCVKNSKGVKCKDSAITVDLKTDNYQHIHTEVADNIALILLSQKIPEDENQRLTATPKTLIRAVRLEDGQFEFEDKVYPFYTKVGRVRILDQLATLILGGANKFTSNIDMHYLRFNMSTAQFPSNVGSLTSFHNHVCPSQISWAPRSSNVVYVASVCDKSSIDNHVFRYEINFAKPFLSEITEVYVIEGSRDFKICAQDRLLNIIDIERDVFYSFDTQSSINAKLYFPTKEYGIKDLKTYSCDQNNNILQIIGCEDDTRKKCYLVTYKANLAHVPNKRVHSIQQIDPSTEFISSSFNDVNDDTITLLFGKSTATRYAYMLEVDGPHIRLRANTQDSKGTFSIKENFAFMGKDGVINDDNLKVIPSEHNLTLVPQGIDINMHLTVPNKNMLMDGTPQSMDDFVTITGPFHSTISTTVEGAELVDRLSPSTQFAGLEPTFDDAMYHKDFVFGYKKDGLISKLGVYSVGKTLLEVPDLDSISDLQFVAKSDTEFYFFALVRKQYKKDRIYTIYTKNNGTSWTTAHTSLDSEGYKIMEINNGPDNYFSFGGYNNLRGYKSIVFAFRVEDKSIIGSAPNPYKFEDNIADYDINFIEGTRYVIVVAGVEYSKQAEFFWYEIDESGYMSLIGQQKSSLIPNIKETHEDVVFRCEQRNNSKDFLWCINSGKNLYSYFVKYQLDWTKPASGLARNFISKTMIHTKLKNIVNLKPTRVDLLGDYISFMVKNLDPVKTGSTKHPGAFFSDTYMCLTYKISSNAEPVEDSAIPVRDVYKILTMGDLEVTDLKLLENLDPRYFSAPDGSPKLGVNVGTTGKSTKVFNLNGLSITLNDEKDAHRDFVISFNTINDGVTSSFPAKNFFEIKKKPDPTPVGGPCFKGTISNVKLLKGDIHAVDIDSLLIDNQVDITYKTNLEIAEQMVSTIRTFNWDPSDYNLNETIHGSIKTCTSYSPGLSDGDWAFLCDENKIVFVSVNETSGAFDEQRTVVVNLATGANDAETKCDSIRNGGTQNLYAVCSRPTDSNIYIYSIDLAAPSRRDPDVIIQPETEAKMKAPFKLWVDEYSTDAGSQVVLILHEREPTTPDLKFKMIKNRKGKLVDGGYFSTKLPGTTLNAREGQLQSVFINDEFVILQAKSGSKNFLQRCLRNPIYSQFKCDDRITELAEGDYRIKLFYVDKTKRTSKMTWVYYVSTDRIRYDLYDPDNGSYVADVENYSFSGHSLRRVVDFQRAGNNFFLIGPTKDLNVADGIVKVKTKSNTWEEYSFGPTASLGLVMQDLHETHYANYLAVGTNKIMFRRIKKNILMVNTATAETQSAQVKVSLTCKGNTKDTASTLEFTVNTQIEVNDDSSIRINIPTVEAYAGSSLIYLPMNGDEFAGNAPVFNSITKDPLTNLDYEYLMFNREDFTYEAPELTGLTGLKHVGDNIFAVENKDTLMFIQCKNPDDTKFVCKDYSMKFDLKTDNLAHIHTEVVDGIALIVLSTIPPADDAERLKATPKTTIMGVRLEDSQKEFEDKSYPFYTKIGRARSLDQMATIILGGSPNYVGNIDMHYLRFNMTSGKFPMSIGSLTSFRNHLCPAQISWAPRASNVLYVSSICDKNGMDNHVFKYDINFEEPFKSSITEVYVIEGSRDFKICAQERLLNIVDLERDEFYAFDTQSALQTKLYFPTKVYGIADLKTYSCDQNNNILQVVGCTNTRRDNCYVMTYRGNVAQQPNRRVHSLIEIDASVEFIASSFNDENDDTITLMMGKNSDLRYLNSLEVDGPHIRLKAEKENTNGTFLIKENFAFQGVNATTTDVNQSNWKYVSVEHNLTLVRQATEVKMELVEPKKKMKMDGTLQNVEDFVTITGPFHSIATDPESKVQINDRMTPSLQFDSLKTTFDDALFFKDYIFGYFGDGGVTMTLAVYQNNTEKFTIPSLDSISDLQFVAKSDTEFYFFALVRKQYKKDRIYTIYTKNNGQTWATAHTSLDSEGYKILEVSNGPDEYFFFGGYNNLRGYKTQVFGFKIEGKEIIGEAAAPYVLNDNIVDFDITFIEGTRYVIVVAGMEYAKTATFLWYELDQIGFISLMGEQREALVPNHSETHESIVFKCEQRNNSKDWLWCVNSGKNMYSYLTKYQLDWTKPASGLATKFIKSTKVETKFRNIVNLQPIEVALNEDYITFMVNNLQPLKTASNDQPPGAFFEDTHLCLTYKITANAAAVDETQIPVRDVFKILSKEDFGVKNSKDLKNLVPRYFKDLDGKVKLGINVGSGEKSVKVFNLSPLSIILDAKNEAHQKYTIKLRTIDNKQTTQFKVADFFDVNNQPDPNKPEAPKSKSALTLIMIICIVVVLIVLGVVGFIVSQKPSQPAEEEAVMDEVEKTMKLPDETDASGEYTKL